ncbi:GntR family transcriptional regulator [Defluviimonas sp. WL0002]|uniref:GntR family transcriptional regulator n=1 Tax=Albidovulum marisflavi TaxID=2984159 RepID=A0ABT2Z9N1_9RHOB|nr:GntR family transcriptional regulator [Defluviimonas sp. WL0002]MCV2867840.1 GntR family transcriptional regulator [Defluviimonas sp. WL0002]
MATVGTAVEHNSREDELGEDEIVDRIFEAIIDQRLPPGMKLSEAALCEAFGVGRMRIRQSLLLLSSREVVNLQPNRGAFVASPSAEQAREVFETRLMIEPNVARLAAERATPAHLELLARHLELEAEALRNNRRRDSIRLSGQFHVHLADVAGNSVALRMVKELVTRTSLIIGIFSSGGVSNCRDEDHGEILDALRARDSNRAARLMSSHLEHIQAHLELGGQVEPPSDLVAIFRR